MSFCTQKYDGAKSQPVTEMYHLNDAGQIELVDMGGYMRDQEGIEAFLKSMGKVEMRRVMDVYI